MSNDWVFLFYGGMTLFGGIFFFIKLSNIVFFELVLQEELLFLTMVFMMWFVGTVGMLHTIKYRIEPVQGKSK